MRLIEVRRIGPIMVALSAGMTVAGCASDRIAGPAGTAARYVTVFQKDLVQLQAQLADYRKQQTANDNARVVDTSVAMSSVSQVQNEMALLACKTPVEVFSSLRSQGDAQIVAELANPITLASDEIELPTDKLAAVAAGLDDLSKTPGTKADLNVLILYGKSVNTALQAHEKAASAPAAQ